MAHHSCLQALSKAFVTFGGMDTAMFPPSKLERLMRCGV